MAVGISSVSAGPAQKKRKGLLSPPPSGLLGAGKGSEGLKTPATPTPGSKPSTPPGLAKKPGGMAPGQYKHQQAQTGPYKPGGPKAVPSPVVGTTPNPVQKVSERGPQRGPELGRPQNSRPQVRPALPGSPSQAPSSKPLARPITSRPLVTGSPPRGLLRGRGRKRGLRRRFPG